MSEGDIAVLHERDRDRGSHARCGRIGARAGVHAPVRLLNEVIDAVLTACGGAALLQRGRGETRCNLSRLGAAHAVGDGKERRLADVGVLVPAPLATGIRDHPYMSETRHCSYLRSVSPTRTMSPRASRRGRSSRVPLRYVPFVEPRSCTQTPSWRGSKRAWRAEAYSSVSIAMSFWPPRPMVSPAELSSKSSPSSRSGLFTTTRRPVRGPGREVCSPAVAGARMKLSCGRRRSRAPVRTMR